MTNHSSRPALRSLTLRELEAKNLPPRGYLLSPWLREQESVLLWAAAGVGKSMLAMTLALAVAGGGEVLGWTAPEPRRVLWVDGELPLDDLQARFRDLAATIQGHDHESALDNLQVLARHHQDPSTPFPDFGDPEQQDDVLATLRSYRPALVVLDNLSTLATLDDENAAAETQRVVKLLARLKQARIAVLVVHHSGKSGTSFRGSSMLATTFEAIVGLTRDKGQDVLDGAGTARFKLQWNKFRGKRDASIGDRSVALEETREGELKGLRWAAELPADETLQALAALVRSGRYSTQAEAGAALPEHLWPKGTPPSAGWISGQFKLMAAKGILSRADAKAFFEAAEGGPEGYDGPAHEDL